VGVQVSRKYAEAFPDGKIELKEVHAQGDTSVAEFLGKGTHRGDFMGIAPTGKRVEIPVCNVIEVRDGKVIREREYMDNLHMMIQLGVIADPTREHVGAPGSGGR
jgi:predicted ester cyclase